MIVKKEGNTSRLTTTEEQAIKAVLMPLAELLVNEFLKQCSEKSEKKNYEKENIQRQQKSSNILPCFDRRAGGSWRESF